MRGRPIHPDREAALASHCWFPGTDRVSGDEATTAWKRTARLRQARWREGRGHPIGHEPYAGGEGATRVGSRLELAYAAANGANFISPRAFFEAQRRVASPEPHEMLAADRLWADLLSSMPLCFNLFADLAADGELAARAIRAWWPDAPTGPVSVRFEHSPGRRDESFLGNRSAFDVAFEIDRGDGTFGIVGVETKYHEHAKREERPRERALARYAEVSERAGIFRDGWRDAVIGTELQQLWLDHLLGLSMLQHRSKRWSWARFVLVQPRENASFMRAAARYRDLLQDDRTFGTYTIEALLQSGVIPDVTTVPFRERYL